MHVEVSQAPVRPRLRFKSLLCKFIQSGLDPCNLDSRPEIRKDRRLTLREALSLVLAATPEIGVIKEPLVAVASAGEPSAFPQGSKIPSGSMAGAPTTLPAVAAGSMLDGRPRPSQPTASGISKFGRLTVLNWNLQLAPQDDQDMSRSCIKD
jgi:hypothetical protein